MVRVVLDGRKTQTRLVMKEQPDTRNRENLGFENGDLVEYTRIASCWNEVSRFRCPYGKVGDLLWVRETFADVNDHGCPAILYKSDETTLDFMQDERYLCEDGSLNYDHPHIKKYYYSQWIYDVESGEPHHGWRPSVHMPRWASRLTLEITYIRVERLQDISRKDAGAEGVPHSVWRANGQVYGVDMPVQQAFGKLWTSIYGPESWNKNPFVWVIEFKEHHQNIEDFLKEASQ